MSARARGVRRAFALVVAGCIAVSSAARAAPEAPVADAPPGPEAVTHTAPAAPLIPYPSRLSLSQGDAVAASGEDPSRTTLAPAPSDTSGIDEVEIAPRKTVVLSSQGVWEKGFDTLAATFRVLDEIVMAAGFDVKGRPFAVFTQTDDAGFRFDAMLPIATDGDESAAAEALREAVAEHVAAQTEKAGAPAPAPELRIGTSPAGKAFRFLHASTYDDIETAYEAITAYLDNRGIEVEDAFIEEYVTDLTLPTDEALEVYIYVQPKVKPVQPQATQPQETTQPQGAEETAGGEERPAADAVDGGAEAGQAEPPPP